MRRPTRSVMALGVILMLAGCNENEAITRSVSPPILLGERHVTVPLRPGFEDADIARAMTALGDPHDIHVVLNTADAATGERVIAILRRYGVDSARIRTVSSEGQTVVLRVFTQALPDCGAALHPSWFGDVSNSMTALGQCTRAVALGEEIADPGDLVSPAHLGLASGARFGRVVQDWENGGDRKGASESSGGGGSSSRGSASSGDSARPAPESASESTPESTPGSVPGAGLNATQSGIADNPLLSGPPVVPGDRRE